MRQIEVIFEELKEGVVGGARFSQLTVLASELDICIVIAGEFSLSVSAEILRLLDDDRFLRQPNSWLLARLVSDEWHYFPDESKPELARKLQASFGRFSDSLGSFVTAEALAKHLEPLRALSAFRELYASTQAPARAMLAVGLRELTLRPLDEELGKQVAQFLLQMSHDADTNVRNEAVAVMKKMKARDGN